MLYYFLSFVALAVFPLVLAAIGGHLATLALPAGQGRKRWIAAVWGVAVIGIAVFGVVQLMSYRADIRRDESQEAFRRDTLRKLDQIIAEPDRSKRTEEAKTLKEQVKRQRPQPPRNPGVAGGPAQPPVVDPRLALVAEVNDLADKIDNIGDDYSTQLTAEKEKQLHLPPTVAASEKPFSDKRLDDMREYERKRYATLYRDNAIALRAKILEEIPDIPPMGLATTEAHWVYENPVNAIGFKSVADNLHALAKAYEQHIKSVKP